MHREIVHTDAAPKAIGPYSQAIATDGLIFTSGQLGIDMTTGKLAEGVENQTHCALKNLGAILTANQLDYGNVIKTTVFVKDLADFAKINAIYGEYFAQGYPARSCVQVAALPMGGLVEIECIAVR